MVKVVLIILLVAVILFAILFSIYFFNLDMKFTVKVVAPILEKHYNKRKRKQYI